MNENCEVYWGSHGCDHPKGHDGPHECGCCECPDHERDHEARGCAAKPPYYGPDTKFYGDDAAALGLQPVFRFDVNGKPERVRA